MGRALSGKGVLKMNHLFLRGKEPQGLVLFLPAEEGGRVHLGQPGGGPKGRGLGQIDGLDLRCLTEFKRSSNGAVEVKLTDRVAVLEKLLEQQKAEEDGLGAFLEAMDRPAAPEGMCSQR